MGRGTGRPPRRRAGRGAALSGVRLDRAPRPCGTAGRGADPGRGRGGADRGGGRARAARRGPRGARRGRGGAGRRRRARRASARRPSRPSSPTRRSSRRRSPPRRPAPTSWRGPTRRRSRRRTAARSPPRARRRSARRPPACCGRPANAPPRPTPSWPSASSRAASPAATTWTAPRARHERSRRLATLVKAHDDATIKAAERRRVAEQAAAGLEPPELGLLEQAATRGRGGGRRGARVRRDAQGPLRRRREAARAPEQPRGGGGRSGRTLRERRPPRRRRRRPQRAPDLLPELRARRLPRRRPRRRLGAPPPHEQEPLLPRPHGGAQRAPADAPASTSWSTTPGPALPGRSPLSPGARSSWPPSRWPWASPRSCRRSPAASAWRRSSWTRASARWTTSRSTSPISALEGLNAGGRLVGIISHVGELRERVYARLEVTADKDGSRAAFHVA